MLEARKSTEPFVSKEATSDHHVTPRVSSMETNRLSKHRAALYRVQPEKLEKTKATSSYLTECGPKILVYHLNKSFIKMYILVSAID